MIEEGVSGTVGRLRSEVTDGLKRQFVGRDEVVDLIALAIVAGEHLFLTEPDQVDRPEDLVGFGKPGQQIFEISSLNGGRELADQGRLGGAERSAYGGDAIPACRRTVVE